MDKLKRYEGVLRGGDYEGRTVLTDSLPNDPTIGGEGSSLQLIDVGKQTFVYWGELTPEGFPVYEFLM